MNARSSLLFLLRFLPLPCLHQIALETAEAAADRLGQRTLREHTHTHARNTHAHAHIELPTPSRYSHKSERETNLRRLVPLDWRAVENRELRPLDVLNAELKRVEEKDRR